MAQVVTQLIVDASGAKTGVAEFEAAMAKAKALSIEYSGATSTSFERAQQRWTQALGATDPVIKAQIAMERDLAKQRVIGSDAVRLGIATEAAAAAQLAKVRQQHEANIQTIKEHTGQLTAAERAQMAFGKATSGVSGQLIALSAGAGPVGVFLSALGPLGIAAAVGIGAAEKTLGAMAAAAHELAQKSQELRVFSETTGLTTAQVQALRSEASKFGLTGDEVQQAIQQFTARFNELRVGQGELLTQVRRVNPALAQQMQGATDAATAITLFGQALQQTDNIFERNALVKAAAGRGGLRTAAFFMGLGDVNGLTQSFVDSGKALDANLINKLSQLEIEIAKTSARAKQNIASIFAVDTLQIQLSYEKSWLDFSESVKNFSISGDLRYLLESVLKIQIGGPGTLLGKLGINFGAGYKVPDAWAANMTYMTGTGSSGAAGPRTPEAIAADAKRLVDILGQLATVEQTVTARQAELNVVQKNNPDITNAQVKALVDLARATADGTLAMKAQADSARVEAEMLGMTVGAATAYRLEQDKVNEAKRTGQSVSEATRAAWHQEAQAAGEAAAALEKAKIKSEISRGRETVFLSPDNVQIAERLKGLYPDITTALASAEASQMRLNNAMALGHSIAIQFVQTLVQGMFDNKAGVDAVSKGFEALSKSLASNAIKSLLQGDFEKAAVSAISAVVTWVVSLVSHTNDLKGTIDTLDRLNQLRLRQITANADTDTLQGQLAVFNANAILQQIDEARKGGALMGALLQVQQQERLKIERDFQKQAGEIEKQAAEDRLRRQQSFQDRAFNALNDTSTLEGALAAQQRQFAQEQLDEEKAGGQALTDLLIAQQNEEFALRREFADKAIEETKRQAQEQLDAQTRAAKGIVDYINNLKVGPDSSLSPTAKLAAAQSTYNSILALAQTGNIDALGRITQDFENFRKAAQAVYGSANPYQNILNTGIGQLQGLPAVATSTDPVVQALLNVQSAVQATTTAVQGTTASVNTNTNVTTAESNKLDVSNTFLTSMNTFTNRTVNAINNLGGVMAPLLSNISQNTGGTRSGTDYIAAHTTGPAGGSYAVLSILNSLGLSYTAAAAGGVIPPYGLGLISEHLNPTWVRAGPEPITVSPFGAASNDNGDTRAIRQELGEIKRVLSAVGAAMVNAEAMSGREVKEAIVAAISEQTETIKADARQDRNNPQRKVA